ERVLHPPPDEPWGASAAWTRGWRPRCSVLPGAVDDRPPQGLEREIEPHDGRRCRGVDAELLLADGVHHEEVPMHLVALRRGGAHVVESAAVVADVERVAGETVVARTGAARQLADVAGDVH